MWYITEELYHGAKLRRLHIEQWIGIFLISVEADQFQTVYLYHVLGIM